MALQWWRTRIRVTASSSSIWGTSGNLEVFSLREAEGTAAGSSTVSGIAPIGYLLEGYRFRNDDGSETTATWIDSQDVSIPEEKLVCRRLRILTEVSGDPDAYTITLQYRQVGQPTWRTV